MNARGQRGVLYATIIFTVLYMTFAGWLILNKETTTAALALNEWGDFLAGICGPLALFWVIASVIMQGMELSEQRAEMEKQANALEIQASYIERELKREEEDKCWRDIQELLESLRELVPIAGDGDERDDDYVRFDFKNGAAFFKYSPPETVAADNMSTILFLGRAAGGINHSIRNLRPAIQGGHAVQCPKGRIKFNRMREIVLTIDKMAAELSDSRKIVLAGCRLEEWLAHLDLVALAYEKHGGSRMTK